MSLYDEDSSTGGSTTGLNDVADGKLIDPAYVRDDDATACSTIAADGGTSDTTLPMQVTWFGVARASAPLICCHFIHYNAWAIGSVPSNYVINLIACESHTTSACASSLAWQSILGLLNPAVQFLFAKLFADLSDTYGRKPFLLVACCAIFFYGLFFALSTNMWLLLFGYTLEGIFAVGFSSGQAYITDITTDSTGQATANRAVSIAAYISITQGATNLIGTLTAVVMMEALGITPQNTMWAIVALAVFEVPMLWYFVEESLPPTRRRNFDLKQANPLGVVRSVFHRDAFFSRMMISFALSSTGALFLSSTWVNFCDAALGWGTLGSSATIIIFGASLVMIPPALVKAFGERGAMSLGFRVMIATYVALVGIGWYTPYHGDCTAPDGSLVPDPVPSLDACRELPAVWSDFKDAAGCSDGISSSPTECQKAVEAPPPGWTNGLNWRTPLWCDVVVFIAPVACTTLYILGASALVALNAAVQACRPGHLLAVLVDADGTGYMFDSAQRSYISKQVGESEQGSLQGTLLSISLITAAFASFLSNLCFSFFLSDTFVAAVGQKFPGGQFLVSAVCFALAEWNTNNAFATPAVSAHDRVYQRSSASKCTTQTASERGLDQTLLCS